IDNVRQGRRGRVSYPILKMFLESGEPLVKLDRTGMQQSFQALYSSLRAYIVSHNLPVKLFSRQGELYLARTDIEGMEEVGKGADGAKKTEIHIEPVRITDDEVAKRFAQEKDKADK
ncbi:MAG: hypothetical protein ACWGQW_24955, partial [bacterium]